MSELAKRNSGKELYSAMETNRSDGARPGWTVLNQYQKVDLPGKNASFWEDLIDRVDELNIARPAYYAVCYVTHYFGTRIPTDTLATLTAAAPSRLSKSLMDWV